MRGMRPAVLLAFLAAGLAALASGGEAPPAAPIPVHPDPAALTEAAVDALRAFLRSDAPAAREALDRIHAGCRRLDATEATPWPDEVRAHDRAFHAPLDLARELASAGKPDAAFREYTLMIRSCRTCHAAAGVRP